jgi:hypothetical protein
MADAEDKSLGGGRTGRYLEGMLDIEDKTVDCNAEKSGNSSINGRPGLPSVCAGGSGSAIR